MLTFSYPWWAFGFYHYNIYLYIYWQNVKMSMAQFSSSMHCIISLLDIISFSKINIFTWYLYTHIQKKKKKNPISSFIQTWISYIFYLIHFCCETLEVMLFVVVKLLKKMFRYFKYRLFLIIFKFWKCFKFL